MQSFSSKSLCGIQHNSVELGVSFYTSAQSLIRLILSLCKLDDISVTCATSGSLEDDDFNIVNTDSENRYIAFSTSLGRSKLYKGFAMQYPPTDQCIHKIDGHSGGLSRYSTVPCAHKSTPLGPPSE